MTLPASVRVNVLASFPTRIIGRAFLSLLKNNGIWQFVPDYRVLDNLAGLTSTSIVAVQDAATGSFFQVPVSALLAALSNTYRMVTVAGDVTVLPTDTVILLNKTVGAATNILAPTASSRVGVPVRIKDYKRDAATNNITFVLNGSETLDGLNQATADMAGLTKINLDGGERTFYPLTAGGWYL